MKRTSALIGASILSVSILCLAGLSTTAQAQAPLTKEAVSKVLAAHSFTPPAVLEGANGSVWYVSCRSLEPEWTSQAVVGVTGGTASSVTVTVFHRAKPDGPWAAATDRTSTETIARIERSMKEQLAKGFAKRATR